MGHTFDVEHIPVVRARVEAFFREAGDGRATA
jgi:hypothetical protein